MGGASGGGGRCPFAGGGGTPETPALCPLCHPGVPSMSPPTAQSPQPSGAPAPQYSPPCATLGSLCPLSPCPLSHPQPPKSLISPGSTSLPCPLPCTLMSPAPHHVPCPLVPCSVSPVPPHQIHPGLRVPPVPSGPLGPHVLCPPPESPVSSLCPLCHPRLPESPAPLGSLPLHVPSHSGVRPFTSPVPDVPTRRGVPVSPWHCGDSGGPAVALFSLVGFVQMAIWAQGKHRSYLREFRDYPPLRSPIIPFLL